METKGYIESKVESKSQGNLKAILYLLQNNLEEFGREVNSSYELLKLGEKTKLTEAIEHALNDPMGNINNISLEIDQQIKNMLDIFVGSWLIPLITSSQNLKIKIWIPFISLCQSSIFILVTMS